MKPLYKGALPALLLLLSACSILPETVAPDVYLLPASTTNTPSSQALELSLRISAPTASLALDSQRIAVVPGNSQLSSYQGARWSDRAPALLRDRLMDAFSADGRIRQLSSDEANLQADIELNGELRAFQSEYQAGQPVVHIRYEARLINPQREILKAHSFEIRQPAQGTAVAEVVAAFGLAGDQLAKQVVDWVVKNLPASALAH